MGGVAGLDFGAVLTFAQSLRIDTALLSEVLPNVGTFIVRMHNQKDE
jgi:hypothetical protein